MPGPHLRNTADASVDKRSNHPASARLGARRIACLALLAGLFYALALPWVLRPWFPAAETLPKSELRYKSMEDTDLLLNAWILAWLPHAALEMPQQLFDGNVFHPATNVIAGSENMLQHLPLTLTVTVLGGDAIKILAAVVAESFVVAGVGMFLFVFWHSGNPLAALLAGALFTFAPWRVQNIPHPQYLATGWLPLALLAVDIWLETRRWRAVAGLAAAFALQISACLYLGYFAGFAIPIYAFVRILMGRENRARALAGVVLGLGLGGLLVLPLALPYLGARAAGVIPPWEIASWGDWSWKPWWYFARPFLQRAGPVVLLIVATDGLARCWRRLQSRRHSRESKNIVLNPDSRPPQTPAFDSTTTGPAKELRIWPAERALWAMAAIAAWLSAGPQPTLPGGMPLPTPYPFLQWIVPGFAELRGPGRLYIIVLAAISAIAGFAAARWQARFFNSRALPALLVSVGLLLCLITAAPHPAPLLETSLQPGASAVHDWLSRNGESAPVLELPAPITDHDIRGNYRSALAMFESTRGWWPLLNGMTGHPPVTARFMNAIVRRLPEASALQMLVNTTDVHWLIVDEDALLEHERAHWRGFTPTGLQLRERFGASSLYEIILPPNRNLRDIVRAAGAKTAASVPRPVGSIDGPTPAPLKERCRHARIDSIEVPPVFAMAPLPLAVPLVFSNLSDCVWPGLAIRPEGLVGLSYRWTDPTGESFLYPPPAFSPLLSDVAAGSTTRSSVVVLPPSGAQGRWTLDIDLLQWGQAKPLASTRSQVEVRAFPQP